MTSTIAIAPLATLPPDAIQPLLDASRSEGLRLVERLADEYASGANRFDRPGELLLGAYAAGQLVGVGGVNRDPYARDACVARMRHLYVLPAWRRRSVGRQLVAALIAAAAPHFAVLRLRTTNPAADRFYQSIGFLVAEGDADATHALELAAFRALRA
jgi:GNAT superfamily N-acetyltransferase